MRKRIRYLVRGIIISLADSLDWYICLRNQHDMWVCSYLEEMIQVSCWIAIKINLVTLTNIAGVLITRPGVWAVFTCIHMLLCIHSCRCVMTLHPTTARRGHFPRLTATTAFLCHPSFCIIHSRKARYGLAFSNFFIPHSLLISRSQTELGI